MSDIEKGLQYMHQKSAEVSVSLLFRDFGSKLEEFNRHLDLLFSYEETIPRGSDVYRARAVGLRNYGDLEVVEAEHGQTSLYGFEPEKMLAPPAEKATAGRANKTGESFLYLANKPEVCCAEVRPIFTEMISVVQLSTKEDIRVLNLKSCNVENASLVEIEMLKRVMFAFVEPVKDQNDDNYSLTQYIAGYYSEKGFEGIKYGTLNSDDPDSFNLVVFDEKYVTWDHEKKTEVYRVISKSTTFQNLTDKQGIVEVKNGHRKLEVDDVDKIIRKLK